jgi:thiol-disulfide isomerase/thioredoxin
MRTYQRGKDEQNCRIISSGLDLAFFCTFTIKISIMRLYIFIFSFAIASNSFAQVDQKTKTVLQKTEKAVLGLSNYSYDLLREYKYPSDNYDVTKKSRVNFYKNERDSILGYNIYSISKENTSFYRNFQSFTLEHNNNTLQIYKQVDSSDISSNSFVSYSIIAIQKLITNLIQLKDVITSTTDSTIKGKKYYKVKIITQKKYFDFYDLVYVDDKDFVREIFLLIDVNTYLPYQYYAKFRITDYGIDFLRNTYENIKRNIILLDEKKWEPGNYMPRYSLKIDNKEKKLISIGDSLPITLLQKYTTSGSSAISTASFKNKKTIFYFWIKSCGPCLASFPKLKAFQNEYANREVDIVMVNCFDKEKDIAFFYNKHKTNYTMLFNGLDLQNKIGIVAYPTVVVIDSNQKVLYNGDWNEILIRKIL